MATDTRAVGEAAAIAIGGTIGLDAMFGGPITGASMNPARSLGPALVPGDLHALWLYIAAPSLGAALGGLAYQFVRGERRTRQSSTALKPRRRGRENVLFVCVANGGRSVLAERFFAEQPAAGTTRVPPEASRGRSASAGRGSAEGDRDRR